VRAVSLRVLLVVTACAGPGLAQAQGAADEVVISGSPWVADAPTRIADASGFFDAAGAAGVRVDYAASGRASLAALMAGDADFALMASVPLAMELLDAIESGRAREQWPVVIASVALSNGTHEIVARKTARQAFATPAGLAGARVGLLLNSSGHFGLDQFLRFHALDAGRVRLIDAGPGTWAEGLAGGRFDAVVSWDPWTGRVRRRVGDAARVFSLQALDSVSWLLVGRRGDIRRFPDRVDQVLRGYARSIEHLYDQGGDALRRLELNADVVAEGGVIWKLALDWPVLANVEQKLAWAAEVTALPVPRLRPRAYIERAPLERLRPGSVTLPIWIDGEASGGGR